MRRLIGESASLLKLSATGKEILCLLYRHPKGLLVREIIAKTQRSERAVKEHLKRLLHLHLVRRKHFITRCRRLAHRYFFPRKEDFFESVKAEMGRRLRGVRKLLGKP